MEALVIRQVQVYVLIVLILLAKSVGRVRLHVTDEFLHSLGEGDHCETNSVHVDLGLARSNLTDAFLTPVASEEGFNKPDVFTLVQLPSDDLHDDRSLETECVGGAVVDTFAVGEEVSRCVNLSDNWTIGNELSLDAINALGHAEVDELVYVSLLSALLILEVVLWADTIGALVARRWNETSSLCEVHYLGNFTSFAASTLSAVEDLVNGEFDLLFDSLANSVF